MKQKGTEKLTCFLRVSPSVKYRLDINSGTQSNNAYISQMMEYFEVSGVTPQQITKQPIVQIQKRIEDVIKILRSYEREYFRPTGNSNTGNKAESEDYARLMNELRDLKEQNGKLRQQLAESGPSGREEEYREKLHRLAGLVKYQLDPDRLQKVKFSDDVKVPISQLRLLFKKIDEDYVL